MLLGHRRASGGVTVAAFAGFPSNSAQWATKSAGMSRQHDTKDMDFMVRMGFGSVLFAEPARHKAHTVASRRPLLWPRPRMNSGVAGRLEIAFNYQRRKSTPGITE